MLTTQILLCKYPFVYPLIHPVTECNNLIYDRGAPAIFSPTAHAINCYYDDLSPTGQILL